MTTMGPIIEQLPIALNIAHKLQETGTSIGTITDALSKAGFPERIQKTIRTLIESEAGQGHKPCTKYQEEPRYQQQPSYPSHPNP